MSKMENNIDNVSEKGTDIENTSLVHLKCF